MYELPVPSVAFFADWTLQLHWSSSPGDGVELDFFWGLSKPIFMAREHMHCTYLAFSPQCLELTPFSCKLKFHILLIPMCSVKIRNW